MHRALAKNVIFLIALSLVVPESYARRLGSGRSTGRQAPISRQSTTGSQPLPARQYAPPPPAAPPLRPQPAPARPMQPAPAQAGPWGGMLGGALLGLGLGSLLSSGDRNNNLPNQNTNNGGNRDASGTTNGMDASGNPKAAGTTTAQQPASSGFGSLLLWGILGLAAFFLVRRLRTRATQRRF